MIRQATKYDKTQIIKLMKEFRANAEFPELLDINNDDYWNVLLDNIFAGQGVIFIEEEKGLLIGLIIPSVWDNKTLILHELAWYVRPEFRGGTTGFRLFMAYVEYGKQLKTQGRIKYFTMSKLDNSPNLKYQKYGFRKKDENWIQ